MKVQSIFVYTHDSIGLGEDGPTHQAIEQIPTLRMIPGMSVWRPCDTVESAVAWQAAMSARMAETSKSIVTGENTAGQESENQYRLLAGFLNT
jgi:transketolase